MKLDDDGDHTHEITWWKCFLFTYTSTIYKMKQISLWCDDIKTNKTQ